MFAWVVNDVRLLDVLVRRGIDAAVSDSLSIIELLGGDRRAEHALAPRRGQAG